MCSILYAMKLENCQCLGTRNSSNWPSIVRNSYSHIVCGNALVTTLKKPSLIRTLWRKIKREKRRFLSSSPVVHCQYDPSSYSQNFDDGFSTDPDNVSRSFSARFAMPSKIFEKSHMVGDGDHKYNSNEV